MSPDAAPSNEDIITPLVPRNVLGRMEKQTGRDKDNAGKDLGYDACFTAEIYIYIYFQIISGSSHLAFYLSMFQ